MGPAPPPVSRLDRRPACRTAGEGVRATNDSRGRLSHYSEPCQDAPILLITFLGGVQRILLIEVQRNLTLAKKHHKGCAASARVLPASGTFAWNWNTGVQKMSRVLRKRVPCAHNRTAVLQKWKAVLQKRTPFPRARTPFSRKRCLNVSRRCLVLGKCSRVEQKQGRSWLALGRAGEGARVAMGQFQQRPGKVLLELRNLGKAGSIFLVYS